MRFIQHNNLSHFHDGKRVFFCKTDFLKEDFDVISNLKNKVILITGNSDYPITDDIVKKAPSNIVTWFAVNPLTADPRVRFLPLGLENTEECAREGHGVAYFDRQEKIDLLRNRPKVYPSKTNYLACFKTSTNVEARTSLRNLAKTQANIDWVDPNLSVSDYYDLIEQYHKVLVPIGNGMDTHRFYEVCYLNREPICINDPLNIFHMSMFKNREYLDQDFWFAKLIEEIDRL